jgi:hypothetical protein
MKTLVKITRTSAQGVTTETVEPFETELHFEALLRADNTITGAKHLIGSELEEYLEPLRAAVITADRKKAEAKLILEEAKQANRALFAITGAGYFFQDEENIVYKTDENTNGKFQYYEIIEIKRTRREGEDKGSLSMTQAREAGFVVEGK